MNQPTTYTAYLMYINSIDHYSPVEDIETAVKLAEGLPHWFDRQRAVAALAERVRVHENLLFRMMTRGRA